MDQAKYNGLDERNEFDMLRRRAGDDGTEHIFALFLGTFGESHCLIGSGFPFLFEMSNHLDEHIWQRAPSEHGQRRRARRSRPLQMVGGQTLKAEFAIKNGS